MRKVVLFDWEMRDIGWAYRGDGGTHLGVVGLRGKEAGRGCSKKAAVESGGGRKRRYRRIGISGYRAQNGG